MDIERRLSSVLSEFARTLVTDFPIQAILDHLVVRIVDVLPISAAGVTLISPGTEPQYVAASDDSALRFEMLQTEFNEGPCRAAFESGEAVAVLDLREDDRFPNFAPRALEEGLVAVFTFPLHHGSNQLGALDLYRTSAGGLSAEAIEAAQTLADVASAYLINAQARADLRESSERARQLALHDALTGLPNRTLLVQRLEHAMLRASRSEKVVAVLFADLDLFKSVNDAYGHHVGDELLIAVSGRLSRLLRPGDTLARMAGDEFVALCEDLDVAAAAEPLALRIRSALAVPFALSSGDVQISASVGIAVAGPEETAAQLLEDADAAMYEAKRRGGGRHALVDVRSRVRAVDRVTLNNDLVGAQAREELRLEYQPIVSSVDRQIISVEGLLRWSHATRGKLFPEIVIPLAEGSGLMPAIGLWVLETACVESTGWRIRNEAPVAISVNVSAQQLVSSDFVASVQEVLARTGTDPRLVTFEVAEHLFVRDLAAARTVLDELRTLGVHLALDNFGVGHYSLSSLNDFPVDVLKIDRTVISALDHDPASRLIVKALTGLAHGLGMSVVGVGVESAARFEEVAELGCDACQGFYIARPMSSHEIDVMLTDGLDEPASNPDPRTVGP